MTAGRGRALRLGIVGCGDIAGYTAGLARWNPGYQLAACCDHAPEQAEAFARRFRIPQTFTDYRDLFAEAGLDAVYLAVPHHLHAAMTTEAVERGLSVLVEKPVTRTLAEGRAVAALAQARGVKVGVNYQYRYDAGCYALARAAQRGDLGPVHSARLNLPWRRDRAYFEKSAWHARLDSAGGGTLITQGSHLLDIALWALGARPVSAMGYTARRVFTAVEVEDLAHGIVELAGGALISITSSLAAATEQAVTIELYGERATGIYTDRPWPRVRFVGRRLQSEPPPVWGVHALARSLEAFRRWVQADIPYLCPAPAALPVLAAVEALYHSARTGWREPIQL